MRSAERVRSATGALPLASQALSTTNVLQRQCACGGHTSAGECDSCRKKRAAVRACVRPAGPTPNDTPHGTASRSAGVGADFSQLPVKAVKTPVSVNNTFEDCPRTWSSDANRAVVLARSWVANVLAGLTYLPDPIPPVVATLLNRHFHTSNRKHIAQIVRHYATIYSALNSTIDFECETSCDPNVAAYVYSIWTDLHLCPVWYGLDMKGKTNTIIHEIAHDAANRDDEAYVWQPKYATLSPDDAIDNADSYSCFAQDAS